MIHLSGRWARTARVFHLFDEWLENRMDNGSEAIPIPEDVRRNSMLLSAPAFQLAIPQP